jgi:quercetin dioxygenase-like cupin family protein
MVINIEPKHKFTYDGAQLNIYHANKSEGLPKHQHNYSHATICHNGSCVIRMEGKEKVINKHSGAFNLPGGEWHEIEALEDDTVFVNVFSESKR